MKFSLRTIADIITDNTPSHKMAYVSHIYEDYGAGLMWDTVVVKNIETNESYQALYPKLHDEIVEGKDIPYEEIEELIKTANKLLNRYF